MPRRKKRNGLNKKKQPEEEKTTSEKPSNKDAMDASPDKNEDLTVSKWKGTKQPKRRKFPGPRGTHVPLRVAFEREAHVEVISHVKEFLDSEVCGVFAGDVCEDDEGLFVNIRTAIRGSAARQGRGHVTFTQETWDAIHETLDNEYPNLQVLGWYHSHPGFGVEFSEMDLFIQENFFPTQTLIALVIDPLSGDEAICVNTPEGVKGIDRFWVDGREQKCQQPVSTDGKTTDGQVESEDTIKALETMQVRLTQLMQTLDEQHASVYRSLMGLAMIVAVAIIVWIGFSIFSKVNPQKQEPPELIQYIPIPIQIGEESVMLGIGIVNWDVPPELDPALQLKALRESLAEEDKAEGEDSETVDDATDDTQESGTSDDEVGEPEETDAEEEGSETVDDAIDETQESSATGDGTVEQEE